MLSEETVIYCADPPSRVQSALVPSFAKDRDYSLIDEYDQAWACLHALTYSAMVTESNRQSYPPMNKMEQEEVCQSMRDGAEPPGKSPSYIHCCKMLDEWKLYAYKESSLAKAYQIACRQYNVFPLATLAHSGTTQEKPSDPIFC